MLYCLKKRALIFWVGNPARTQNIMAYSPEPLGGEVDSDSDIPNSITVDKL